MAKVAGVLALVMLCWTSSARADEELPNEPIVAAGWRGECYAKSVPAGVTGDAGTTTIYRVEKNRDVAIETYPWYARNLYLWCAGGHWGKTTLVRVATWPRGRVASNAELAVAFYRDGKQLRRYSTLDLAGKPSAVPASLSHHRIFEDVDGVVWYGNSEVPEFHATRFDGKPLRFSLEDGRLIMDHDKIN